MFRFKSYPKFSDELGKDLAKITNWFKNERARKNIKQEKNTPGRGVSEKGQLKNVQP